MKNCGYIVICKDQQHARGFFLVLMFISIISCQLTLPVDVSARDPRIGTEISHQNGRLVNDIAIVPQDAKRIYFEFFLDIPDNMDVLLEFRWYDDNRILFTYGGRFVKGYTVGFIEQDQNIFTGFSPGNYRVEVWFLNVMLVSKEFQVK